MNGYRNSCHSEFVKTLRNSEKARWTVAEWLSRNDYYVLLPPIRWKENAYRDRNEWSLYSDDGDIYISRSSDMNHSQRIEVKGSGMTFGGRDDFKYNDFLIIQTSQFDKPPQPTAVIHVSSDLKCLASVRSDSKDSWFIKEIFISKYNQKRVNYHCQFEVVKFIPLV